MRDPLSVGVVKFERTPNKLDDYFKSIIQQKADAEKLKAKQQQDQYKDIEKLGGVWERDIENLTKDFIDFRNKKVEFEQEKDPVKKSSLWQESVKMGAKLETNIQKSKKNKEQYVAKAEQINKDNKLFLPENATETLDKWASTSIYDRPDNIGIEMPSSLDFAKEGAAKFKVTIGKPNVTSDKMKVGDRTVEKGHQYYTPEDVDMALESTLSTMPQNFVRAEKARLLDRYNNGLPKEREEAAAALKSPEATQAYLKKVLYSAVQPSLNVDIFEKGIAPATKGSGGGSAKQSYTVTTGQESRGGVMYTNIFSAPKNKTPVTTNWQIPTQLLKDANAKYKLGLDDELSEIDVNSTPTVEISGTFSKVTRNQKTGDITVSINPKQFIDKFFTTNAQITLPLGEENEAPVKAFLNDEDYRQLIEAEEKKKRVPGKKRTAPTPPGAGGSVKEEKATPPKGQRGKFNSKTGKIEYQ